MPSLGLAIFVLGIQSAAVLGIPSAPSPTPQDFDYSSLGFEFIFHDQHDLLLIINNDNCYFANLSDMYNGFLEQDKADILKELYMKIGRGTVAPSSIQEMRDTYNDLLADFHCADKHIFTVEFSLLDINVLVIIYNDKCYYATAPEGMHYDFWQYSREQLLQEAVRAIYNEPVENTTLAEMSAKYHDLVAELDCMDKEIYTTRLDIDNMIKRQENSTFDMNDYHLYYHDDKDLLLLMHNNVCYFAPVQEGILEEKWLTCPISLMAESLRRITKGPVFRSSPATVQDKYHDPLANFECNGMDIYEFQLNATLVETVQSVQKVIILQSSYICTRIANSSVIETNEE
ncbi:hypothetical protein BaRGS_00036335 [Batillaria attramentaria]|uniref:Uncharacterized protein n=1 Tax=Batillaria attramentaria TaxID=370345 RepID=A0ABD0JCC9_9CAEN